MTPEDIAEAAEALRAGFCSIPVEEIIQCARENLRATRRIRLSKDNPDGTDEPDFSTRQRAVEFLSAQRGLAGVKPAEPPTRKVKDTQGDAGTLKPREVGK